MKIESDGVVLHVTEMWWGAITSIAIECPKMQEGLKITLNREQTVDLYQFLKDVVSTDVDDSDRR